MKFKKKYIYIAILSIFMGCTDGDKSESEDKDEIKTEITIPSSPPPSSSVLRVSYEPSEVSPLELTQKQKDVINEHNKKRRNHFSDADMRYSIQLEKEAKIYADTLANSGEFKHDPKNHKNGLGENLYAYSEDRVLTIFDAITPWYDVEKPYYNYDDGSCDEGTFSNGQNIMCGHYTQVIWQNTREVGCASSQYKTGDFKGGYIYVCKYQKPGNIIGLKPYCTEYNRADLYTKNVPSFKQIPLSSKTFPIELVVEDREKCTRKDNYNSAISFGESLSSIVIKDFQIFNNEEYPNTLEFDSVLISDKELKMKGINRHIPNKTLKSKNIYMNIKLVGETKDYYAVELDWNGYDASRPLYSRQMLAKLYK